MWGQVRACRVTTPSSGATPSRGGSDKMTSVWHWQDQSREPPSSRTCVAGARMVWRARSGGGWYPPRVSDRGRGCGAPCWGVETTRTCVWTTQTFRGRGSGWGGVTRRVRIRGLSSSITLPRNRNTQKMNLMWYLYFIISLNNEKFLPPF